MINISDTPIIFNQVQTIYYISYPERLLIAFICVLFWYGFCVIIKREIKKQEIENKKEYKNILWRLMK